MSTTFTSLGVPEDLAAHLTNRGFVEPYPIQSATLTQSLGGADIAAQAPTGSGKTLAFGIPLIANVGKARPRRPRALVLAPTRELVAQIAQELSTLGRVRGVEVATFYGGVGFGKQLDALRRGIEVAVACPGRLMDLLERGALRLADVEIVVVDEADRMSDMGFLPVVRAILDQVGERRQTMLFSATLQGDVDRLVRQYQRSPQRHILDAPADAMGTRSHHFWRAESGDRIRVLVDVLTTHRSAMVFCRTKRGVDRLTRQLVQSGISAALIHGDRTQVQRDRALEAFQASRVQVLVGTDVAARGIHVDDVGCVVHFDPPEDESTYVHRSGRTGRAGGTGMVISLVTREQEGAVRKIQKSLGMAVGIEAPGSLDGVHVIDLPKDGGVPAQPTPVRRGTPRPPAPRQRPVRARTGGDGRDLIGRAGGQKRPSGPRRPQRRAS